MKTKIYKLVISIVDLGHWGDVIESILDDSNFKVHSKKSIEVEWSDDNKYNKSSTDFLTEFDKDFEKANSTCHNSVEYSPDYLQSNETKTNIINVNSNQFVLPLEMKWQPKEDITTYELALCLPYVLYGSTNSIMPDMIDLSQPHFRHFEIINPNKKN